MEESGKWVLTRIGEIQVEDKMTKLIYEKKPMEIY